MNPTTITTLEARKSAEIARRRNAADQVVAELREYAVRNAGRFVIFGSYASNRMHFDSDLDVVIDFPAGDLARAWQFVEDSCAKHALPVDIHDASTTKPAFLDRVREKGICLP